MFKVYRCEKCENAIQIKIMKGFVHIVCLQCGQKYELTHQSVKYYMLIPLISVSLSVLLSINVLKTSDIFLKAVFILSVSYLIYLLLGMLFVKAKLLKYERE